jgi:predicted NodU family carbamoyl transferase
MDGEVPGHAASYAFGPSGFDQATVLIIDSLGETCTTAISSASTLAEGMSGTGSSRP